MEIPRLKVLLRALRRNTKVKVENPRKRPSRHSAAIQDRSCPRPPIARISAPTRKMHRLPRPPFIPMERRHFTRDNAPPPGVVETENVAPTISLREVHHATFQPITTLSIPTRRWCPINPRRRTTLTRMTLSPTMMRTRRTITAVTITSRTRCHGIMATDEM